MKIVQCSDIRKTYPVRRGYLKKGIGVVTALDGVSLEMDRAETFGVVGESGCGKTTLGKIILGILKPDSGAVRVETEKKQVIFQDPQNSLDPKMKVYDIIAEPLAVKGERYDLPRKVGDAADKVKLPKGSLGKYPHEFSGGERQRIAIARAILTRPELIVCDEPVSSLDVSIQLQILKLLKEIQREFSVAYLFISHDLRVVRFMCDRVAVMKQGKIVEEGPVETVYAQPSHPYTKLLLSSILDLYPKRQ